MKQLLKENQQLLKTRWAPLLLGANLFISIVWVLVSFAYLQFTNSNMKEVDAYSGSTTDFYALTSLGIAAAVSFYLGLRFALPRNAPMRKHSAYLKVKRYGILIVIFCLALLSILYISKGWSPPFSGADRFATYQDIPPYIKTLAGQVLLVPLLVAYYRNAFRNWESISAIIMGVVFMIITGEKFSGLATYAAALILGLAASGCTAAQIISKKTVAILISVLAVSLSIGYASKESVYKASEERFLIMQGQVWWQASREDQSQPDRLEDIREWMERNLPARLYNEYSSRGVILSMGGLPLFFERHRYFAFPIVIGSLFALGALLGATTTLLTKRQLVLAIIGFKSYIYFGSFLLMGRFNDTATLKFGVYAFFSALIFLVMLWGIKAGPVPNRLNHRQ